MIRPTPTPSKPDLARSSVASPAGGAARYPFALACVAAATGAVAAVDVMLALTPLALFAVAVGASAARGGVKPGLVAAGLAALVSNYLFVAPRYELSFDWDVAQLIAVYLGTVPAARFLATRLRLTGSAGANAGAKNEPLAQSLSILAPVLILTCAAVAVLVPLLWRTSAGPAPVPALVVAAAFFLVFVSTRRPRGR